MNQFLGQNKKWMLPARRSGELSFALRGYGGRREGWESSLKQVQSRAQHDKYVAMIANTRNNRHLVQKVSYRIGVN